VAEEIKILRENLPLSHCPPQILLDLTRAWTWTTEMGSRWLTTWDTAWPRHTHSYKQHRALITLYDPQHTTYWDNDNIHVGLQHWTQHLIMLLRETELASRDVYLIFTFKATTMLSLYWEQQHHWDRMYVCWWYRSGCYVWPWNWWR
jgi:hypothetical protein